MEIEEILGYIIETYGIIMISVLVIKIIYFLILICKVCETSNETYRTRKKLEEIKDNQETEIQNQKYIIKQLVEENKRLERIAKALEQDSEPYVIETKEDS